MNNKIYLEQNLNVLIKNVFRRASSFVVGEEVEVEGFNGSTLLKVIGISNVSNYYTAIVETRVLKANTASNSKLFCFHPDNLLLSENGLFLLKNIKNDIFLNYYNKTNQVKKIITNVQSIVNGETKNFIEFEVLNPKSGLVVTDSYIFLK